MSSRTEPDGRAAESAAGGGAASAPAEAVEFDPHSARFARDPVGALRALQAQCPVAYSERYGGFWVLSRYEDVVRAARDPAAFSSAPRADGTDAIHIPANRRTPFPRPPLELDPLDFAPYRRLVEPMLSPHAVAAMEDGIARYVDFFLDRVIEEGRMELMRSFATPLPSTVTLDWLGLDPRRWEQYTAAFADVARPGSAESAASRAAMEDLIPVVSGELASRRARPRGDVLSTIVNAVIDGALVADAHAQGMTMLILGGGVSTTADLLAHSLVYLDEHREVHAALLADDQFMRTATEELVRRATPVTTIGRVVTEECMFGTQKIRRGDSVMLGWIAANHDPTVFDDPEEVDLRRWPNRHLAFGLGPHRCLGSNIARTMFRIGLRAILRRMPDFRVIATEVPDDRCIHNAFSRVELAFTPGPRSSFAGATPEPQFHAWGARFGKRPGLAAPASPGPAPRRRPEAADPRSRG